MSARGDDDTHKSNALAPVRAITTTTMSARGDDTHSTDASAPERAMAEEPDGLLISYATANVRTLDPADLRLAHRAGLSTNHTIERLDEEFYKA
eukprot:4354610-Heterocapsa_arctica.AAC.1